MIPAEQLALDVMLESGLPFPDIENYIESLQGLGESVRNALWLYAWVEIDRTERRRAVNEMLIGLRPGI